MSTLGALNIKITADASEMKSELKKAGDALKKGGKKLRSNLNDWAKWGAGIAAAAATASAAIVNSNLKTIRELKNLAGAANATVAEFQRGAYAANQAGISQEKYGDILKDVNDRVGDFLTTGGGPMVDFFEQVAPKIGITANAFKNLSGPQALQLFVSSLEKANLNQQEMTFYMEAMASDSTLLLPLLRDNGKAMGEQAEAAKALGIGLSEIDVDNALKAQKAISDIGFSMDAATQKVVADFSPAIEVLAKDILGVAKDTGQLSDTIFTMAKYGAKGIATIGDGLHAIKLIVYALDPAFQGLKLAVIGIGNEIRQSIVSAMESVVNSIKASGVAIGALNSVMGASFNGAIAKIDEFVKKARMGADITQQMYKDQLALYQSSKSNWDQLADPSLLPTNIVDGYLNKLEQALAKQSELNGAAGSKSFLPPPKSDNSNAITDQSSPEAIQEKMQSETEMILEMLGVRYLSQEELLAQHLEKEFALLQDKKDRGISLTEDEQKQLLDLQKQTEAAKKAAMIGGGRDLLNVLAKHSNAALALQKGFALAQAGVSIATGIARAQELGFPAALGEMARIAGVASEVYSSIKSASKGAASIPTGGGSTPSAPAAQPQAQQQPSSPEKVFNVKLVGQSQSSQSVRELLQMMNEELGNGFALNV